MFEGKLGELGRLSDEAGVGSLDDGRGGGVARLSLLQILGGHWQGDLLEMGRSFESSGRWLNLRALGVANPVNQLGQLREVPVHALERVRVSMEVHRCRVSVEASEVEFLARLDCLCVLSELGLVADSYPSDCPSRSSALFVHTL